VFVVAVLIYPVVLGLLCLGAGLLVERLSGGPLPGALLAAVGAAALIGLSQWTTYFPALAPLTPWAMVLAAAAGFAVARRRAVALMAGIRANGWVVAATAVGYVLAAAPVLFAGRVTFAAYNVLPDSALHMIGADYLIRHGQSYGHLDLINSYGQYIHGYFASSYPSGSHTLFGGSAALLPLPLIWALQPFCACALALAVGPAWLLVRRIGLRAGWAALAAVTVSMPALVYGYALVGSIKELVALPLILTLGALVAARRDGDRDDDGTAGRGARGALPFALVAAGGVSALGVAFSAWAGTAALVLAALLAGDVRGRRRSSRDALRYVGVGLAVGLLAAWPTWIDVPGSLQTAEAIAATPNPGNLYTPLHPAQIFGTWLTGSYRFVPGGHVTDVLIAITAGAALIGAVHAVRTRATALAAWTALGLAVWLGLTAYGKTWTDAKILMLTTPVVVLLAWGGVAGLRGSRRLARLAPLLGLALAWGVLASDEMQYRATDLAPTARYTELASIDGRFGPGPTLFPDFDEWSLYVLRKQDVGGPDFVYRPPALAAIAPHHGDPVDLDAVPAAALRSYPLIVTGRDPLASRPPSAYRLLWEGTYYEVWGRRPGAPAAPAHLGLDATQPASCAAIGRVARVARARHARIVFAAAPQIVPVDFAAAAPAGWRRPVNAQLGVLIRRQGQLRATFTVPHAGVWSLWLQGEIMPTVSIGLDGRRLTSVGGQLRGNVFNPDTLPPIALRLARAGTHALTIARAAGTLAPGDRGSATLQGLFLTPAAQGTAATLHTTAPGRWRSLCGRRLDWVEAVA
jgi:hypothetical protein